MKTPRKQTSTYGFASASKLMQSRIRTASETRGFAETRLLTHWEEIVGANVAQIARPVKIGYGREGMGATLTVLTTGAQAPMLEMQKDQIRDKVNACYGYRAISRVRVTQTAPTGFSDGKVAFGHKPKVIPAPPSAELTAAAHAVVGPVKSDELRLALEALATNVLRKQSS